MNNRHKTREQIISELGMPRDRIGASEGSGGTKQRQAELVPSESEDRFRHMAENIREVFWTAKADLSEMIYISPSYEKVWGRSCASLYDNPKSWMDCIHPLDVERIQTAIGQREDAGHTLEYRIIRVDGTVRWILDRGFPVQKRDGQGDRIAGIAEDITERKEAEEELRENEECHRSLLENCLEAVLLTRPDGAILAANPEACRLLGWTEDELVRIGRQGIVDVTDPRLAPALREREQTGKVRTELTFIRKDGTRFEGVLSSAVFKAGNGELRTSMFILDMTEWKEAEKTLREYEKVVEGSRDMIAVVDRNYRYRLANEAYLKYRDIGKEEFIGKSCAEVLGSDLFEQTVKGYMDRCFLGEVIQYEMKLTYPRIGERDMLIFYLPIKHPEGIDRIVAVMRDVSQKKIYEEALRESEKRYRGLFETMPDGFASVGMDKRMVEANAAFRAMLGYSLEEVCALTYEDITPKKWHAIEERIIHEQVMTRGYSDPYEKECIRKDGTIFHVEIRAHLLRDEKGDPIGMWAFVRDVSGRNRAQKALWESEEKFRRCFELGLIGMAITSPTKGMIEVNDEFCNIMGYERDELLHMTWAQLTHADDLVANLAAFDRVLAGEIDGYSMDKRYIGKDGRIIYTTISVKCLRRPDGSIDYFLTLLQDVTQRKKAEEELKTREKELERKSFDLEEANTALKVLLRHREEDKWALENTIQANVRELVFPYIEKLRNTHLSDSQGTYLGVIESGLNEIISPFLRNMAATYSRFTRTEIQVANLIKGGKSSKEIAELLTVSTGTVETHRNNIRNKLGLRHKDINLQSHLLSL